MSRISGKEILALSGLTLAAAVLRIHHLGQWPLFGDEVNTIVEARDFIRLPDMAGINRWTLLTNFLNHYLTGLSYSLFGESLVSARLFPALFGILAVPVFTLLIRRIFDRRVAFLTGLYMAFSPNLVFLSGFARYNSMLFFFGGTSFLLLLCGILEKRRLPIAAGALCLLLALLTHSTAVMILGVTAVVLAFHAVSDREHRKFHLQALAILLLPCILLGALFLDDLAWKGYVILEKFHGSGAGYSPGRLAASIAYNDGPVHFLLTLAAALLAIRSKRAEGIAAVLYWFLPFSGMLVLSLAFHTGPRYLHSVLPGFYILAAAGTAGLIQRRGGRAGWMRIALPALALACQLPLLASNWLDGGRYDTVSATRFLEACHSERPDEPVYAESHMIYEYLSGDRLDVPELPFTLPELKQALEGHDSALIVFPIQRGIPLGFVGQDYRKWLEERCERLRLFSSRRFDLMRYEIAVYRYKRDGSGGP